MLDPDIARMLQAMQDNGEPPLFHDATPDEARRRGVHVRARYYPPVLMDVSGVEERTIPGPAGDIPVRSTGPRTPPEPRSSSSTAAAGSSATWTRTTATLAAWPPPSAR